MLKSCIFLAVVDLKVMILDPTEAVLLYSEMIWLVELFKVLCLKSLPDAYAVCG